MCSTPNIGPRIMNKSKITFEAWMDQVDRELMALCGVTSESIDDWKYYAAFQAGYTPLNAAKRALQYAKISCNLL